MEESNSPDLIDGLKHPREAINFIGNIDIEQKLFHALNSERMHHAIILSGPKSIGKATLAYRFAKRYLGAKPNGETPLGFIESDPIAQSIAHNTNPDLRVSNRFCPEKQKIMRDISVSSIRDLIKMFELKANNELGRRVAIIDCADDLNFNSANAVLKVLEEPPKGAIFILIANSLGAILPTIKSRCQIYKLKPLESYVLKENVSGIDDVIINLSKGCYGRALALKEKNIGIAYKYLSRALSGLPNSPLEANFALAQNVKDIESFDLIMDLIENWLYRASLASQGLDIDEVEAGESAIMARLFSSIDKRKFSVANKNLLGLRSAVYNNLDKQTAILQALNTIKNMLK